MTLKHRIAIVSLLIGTAISFPAHAGTDDALPGIKPVRKLRVCVLNDQEYPVDEKIIREGISRVSKQYLEHVGIRLKVVGHALWNGKVSNPIDDYVAQIHSACPRKSEVYFVFTNQSKVRSKAGSRYMNFGLVGVVGQADTDHGIVFIYSVEGKKEEEKGPFINPGSRFLLQELGNDARTILEDKSGNPAYISTLMHEIGHLFGLTHSPNERSFMYTPVSGSCSEWTDADVEGILAHKWRTWEKYPAKEKSH